MIILMKLNHEQISLIPEEKYRRVKYRKLNDLYLWYNFNIHKLLEYLMTSKFDDSRYRESCSHASTPSIITQRTFNFVTNSNNDSIILESTNNDILEWFWGSLWAWLHHHSQNDSLSVFFLDFGKDKSLMELNPENMVGVGELKYLNYWLKK